MMKSKFDVELKGSIYILASGILWGIIGPFIRIMSELGASPMLISFLRMGFSFVILFLFIIAKYITRR